MSALKWWGLLYLCTAQWVFAVECSQPPKKINAQIDIFTELWPPYQEMHGGKLTGIATEYIRNVFTHSKITHQFLLTPWSRALRSVHQTPNSLIYSLSRTPEREGLFYWIHKLGHSRTFLVTRSDFATPINQVTEALAHSLVLKRFDATNEYFLNLGFIPNQNMLFVNSSKQALDMIKRGRADFYPITESSFEFHINAGHFQANEFKFIHELKRFNVPLYLAASKKSDPEFVSQLNDVFHCARTAQQSH